MGRVRGTQRVRQDEQKIVRMTRHSKQKEKVRQEERKRHEHQENLPIQEEEVLVGGGMNMYLGEGTGRA